jgi:hypothetical protein
MAIESKSRQVEFPTHERPETEINLGLMIGLGVGLSVLVFGVAFAIGQMGIHFVQDLFMGYPKLNAERIFFQGIITLIWGFSTANVILKLMKNKKERETLDPSLVPEGIDMEDKEQLISIYERIKSMPNLTESLSLTRIARVMAMWINTGDFERVAEYARTQADMDAMESDSTFRRNRLFIWAMPLGGFVGTVFGVAAGIGGFAAFLQQENVTPEQIKFQVGEITTGLAVAFYCTLLGLMTAGLAAFPSLMMERKEEEVLGEVEEFVEDHLLSHMPSMEKKMEFPMEELANAISESMGNVQAQVKFPVEELAQAIDAGFRRLPNPDRYEEVFSRAIAKAGDLINQKYDEFAQNYERRVGELGSQIGGKLEGVANSFSAGTQRLAQQLNDQTQRLAQSLNEMESRQGARLDAAVEEMKRLAQVMPEEFRKAQEKYLETQAKVEAKTTERFEELTEQISTMGKEQAEQFGEAHEKYLDAISELDRKEIARWEKMVADFNTLSGRLADQFKTAVASMDSATARYGDRVDAAAKSLGEQIERVGQIGTEIDKVLRTTQSLETTLRQVGSSDEFRQTLSNLRNHLSASDELLKQLSRPRRVVFQEQRAEE